MKHVMQRLGEIAANFYVLRSCEVAVLVHEAIGKDPNKRWDGWPIFTPLDCEKDLDEALYTLAAAFHHSEPEEGAGEHISERLATAEKALAQYNDALAMFNTLLKVHGMPALDPTHVFTGVRQDLPVGAEVVSGWVVGVPLRMDGTEA